MDDTSALGNAVESGADAGQSQTPEVTQAVSPQTAPIDIEALKKSVLEEVNKSTEQHRRKVQSEADRKIAAMAQQTQAQIDAARRALVESLKEVGVDDDTLQRAESTLPIRQKAAAFDAWQQQQQAMQQAEALDAKAREMIGKLGMKREDFKDNEWGGGMPLDVWYETVAVPKFKSLTEERIKKFAIDSKVAEIQQGREEVQTKAQTGVSAMDTGAGGVPDKSTQLKKKFRNSGRVGDYLRSMEDG